MKSVSGLPRRPGWTPVADTADALAEQCDLAARHGDPKRPVDLRASIALDLERSGIRRLARELAGETCDRCGRPGERIAAGEGEGPATRCVRCRGIDDRVAPRGWKLPRRAAPADRDSESGRHGLPLHEYWGPGGLEALMNAHHEAGDFGGSACSGTEGGWNHLLRALVAAWLHEDAGGGAGGLRITDLKEKYGALAVLAGPLNEVRAGSLKLAVRMSTRVCERCGAPGTWRRHRPALAGMGTSCGRCEKRLAADAAAPMGQVRRVVFDQQVHTGSPPCIDKAIADGIEESGLGLRAYLRDERRRRAKH